MGPEKHSPLATGAAAPSLPAWDQIRSMVQDPVPLPSPLSALSFETRIVLRDALAHYLAQPADVAALRSALRRVADESRAHDLRAEQLMVAFKGLWRSMPQVSAVNDPLARAQLLERLITVCIEEYYA